MTRPAAASHQRGESADQQQPLCYKIAAASLLSCNSPERLFLGAHANRKHTTKGNSGKCSSEWAQSRHTCSKMCTRWGGSVYGAGSGG